MIPIPGNRFWKKHAHNIGIAFDAVKANRTKSGLTALGIMFGVAAVISMIAIGNGARQEILNQLELVGVNNIIIKSRQFSGSGEDPTTMKHGLNPADIDAIRDEIPVVKRISPELNSTYWLVHKQRREQVRLAGVNSAYLDIFNLQTTNFRSFSEEMLREGAPVCILGNGIKNEIFGGIDPVGQQIKCGQNWLHIIGVLEPRNTGQSEIASKGMGHVDNTIFVPYKSMLLRFIHLNAATPQKNDKRKRKNRERPKNYLDKIVVQVDASTYLRPTRDVIQRMLKRRHNGKENFSIIVPELLLKQQQKTRNIFHIVLGSIAGISLLVGGIGIMNIMLASVFERIREIGIRRALGARAYDIVVQFLAEASMISIIGGIAGVLLGIAISILITRIAGILTIISFFSVIVAFSISVLTGIVFGYLPAKKAAKLNPVNALHYE